MNNEYMGKAYLIGKLSNHKSRVTLRYKFYDQKIIPPAILKNTPSSVQALMPAFGWCTTAVDAVADRMMFNGFDQDADDYGFNDIFEANNSDILYDSVILDALISSCSFVYIYKDDDGDLRLQVIDAGNATGIMDPTSGLLKEGYAVLDKDDRGIPTVEAYFTAESTDITYRSKDGERTESIPNPVGIPLLVPVCYKPDAKRPFGHSVISRACMNIQNHAARVFLDSCIASCTTALPPKYVTGLADDVEITDSFAMATSRLIAMYKDENGDSPQVGQFPQINITPFMDEMRLQASSFAGHTGLTVDDLGFVSANPSSVEALRASHNRLKKIALRGQRTIGIGLKNVGYVAACLRDETQYSRAAMRYIEPMWLPIDETDPSTLSIVGDGAIKLNQAVPEFITKKTLSKMTGIEVEDEI